MLTVCGTPTTKISPPAMCLKTPRMFSEILFLIFIAAWKNKWLVIVSYFRMDFSVPSALSKSCYEGLHLLLGLLVCLF